MANWYPSAEFNLQVIDGPLGTYLRRLRNTHNLFQGVSSFESKNFVSEKRIKTAHSYIKADLFSAFNNEVAIELKYRNPMNERHCYDANNWSGQVRRYLRSDERAKHIVVAIISNEFSKMASVPTLGYFIEEMASAATQFGRATTILFGTHTEFYKQFGLQTEDKMLIEQAKLDIIDEFARALPNQNAILEDGDFNGEHFLSFSFGRALI
jgi:hypothetical protein